MNPSESWLLYRCALCGDVFPTGTYGLLTGLLPCPCETRAPVRPQSSDVGDLMREIGAELRARQAATESDP